MPYRLQNNRLDYGDLFWLVVLLLFGGNNLEIIDPRFPLYVDTSIYANAGATLTQQLGFGLLHLNEYLHFCESHQIKKDQLRYRTKDGQKMNVHTLNGSALALPRVMATLLENGQTEKGIVLPDVLVPYTGFDLID